MENFQNFDVRVQHQKKVLFQKHTKIKQANVIIFIISQKLYNLKNLRNKS